MRRLQTFLNALAAEVERHALPVELVLVEWNPPPEKPCLAEVLQWPASSSPCRVRIITVPPDVHRKFAHAEAMPLYQMIAKNVGIRRAAGEFILATNIDILFSGELMRFFAERRLERGRMYRVNRYDVDENVPVDAPVEEQLAYCQGHVLRVNTREGTFAVTQGGAIAAPRKARYTPDAVDIASADAGVSFGAGWHPPEQYFGRVYRAIDAEIELHVQPVDAERALVLELEPVTGPVLKPCPITLMSEANGDLAGVEIAGRSLLKIHIPAGNTRVRLHTGSGVPAAGSYVPRFRVLRCYWGKARISDESSLSTEPSQSRPIARAWQLLTGSSRLVADLFRGSGTGRIGLPLSPKTLARLRIQGGRAWFSLRSEGMPLPEVVPAQLHTNACGDFTLAHRDHWLDLRGYPELDLFSMNLDSVFCYMAHYGGAPEWILPESMRIYHIEHATGSGWTPEGEQLLYRRLAEKGLPWVPNDEVLRWASQMERWKTTLVFNHENWGLAELDLPEAQPHGSG